MVARSKRLASLGRIAHHRRARAGQALARARAERDRADATLGLLRMHFDQYRQKLANTPPDSMEQLRQFQHFIHRLNQAIRQQEQTLQQAERHCRLLQETFNQTHSQYRALDRAREQALDEERKQDDKQLQRLLDEIAGRKPF